MNKAIGVFLSCCLLSCGAAAERNVPAEYAAIQQAIDAAQDGDVVIVQRGTYYEHIRFKGKAITVRAADLSSWDAVQGTMIAGWETEGSCVIFDQGETHASVLEGLTLFGTREGSFVSSATTRFAAGGGILCVNSSPTIRRCFIAHNGAWFGGGIAMFGECRAHIVNCLLMENSADSLGGAILIRREVAMPVGGASGRRVRSAVEPVSIAAAPDSGPAIVNCTIVGCSVGSGSIYAYDVDCGDARPTILNTILHGYNHGLLISDLSCVSHCCIYETHLFQGDHESSTDMVDVSLIPHSLGGFPGFVRVPHGEVTFENWGDEYHLQAASPCANAGSLEALQYGQFDLDGQPRLMAGRIDIGADEVRPELTVVSPRAGDVWTAGSVRDIRWEAPLYEGTVDLLLTVEEGGSRSIIAEAIENTGSHRWEPPATLASNACFVHVVPHVADANVQEVAGGPFAIHPDVAGPAVASTWPTLGGNSQRTGLSGLRGPDVGRVKWRFETGGAVVAGVTAGLEGRMHVACEDGKLHTLDADGRLLWTCEMDSAAVSSPTVGPDGSVFVGSERGTLYAVERNGTVRWTFRTGGAIYSSPAVDTEGRVYVGSADGCLYALAPNGAEQWRFQTKGPGVRARGEVFASPALGSDGSIYVAGLYDPNLYALDPGGGSVKWVCRFGGPGRPFVSPVVGPDGTIYQALLRDTHLYAIEPQGGRIVWSVDLADQNSPGRSGEAWSEPVLGPDGTLYVSAGDPYLRAVDSAGRIRWATRLGDAGGFTLTVDRDGFIYAACEDGSVYRVSPEGRETGRLALSGLPGFPVIAADGLLIVADTRDYSLRVPGERNSVWAIASRTQEDKP